MPAEDPKATLHRYLRRERDALLAKLDGLPERDVRWPVTASGTNLLGLVKHVASVQIGYLGETFGRPFPGDEPWLADDADPQSDLFATADESVATIVAFHHASATFADATIAALDLDAPGKVPWWPPERADVTLHQVLVHLCVETARHAGHADILRETLDGRAGDGRAPDFDATDASWQAYRATLIAIAEESAASHSGGSGK